MKTYGVLAALLFLFINGASASDKQLEQDADNRIRSYLNQPSGVDISLDFLLEALKTRASRLDCSGGTVSIFDGKQIDFQKAGFERLYFASKCLHVQDYDDQDLSLPKRLKINSSRGSLGLITNVSAIEPELKLEVLGALQDIDQIIVQLGNTQK